MAKGNSKPVDVNDANFFAKLDDQEEISTIYKQVTNLKTKLTIQFPDKSSAVFLGDQIVEGILRLRKKSGKNPGAAKQKIIAMFELAGDKYFLHSSLRFDETKDMAHVDIDQPLFKLQRREMFRISIPIDFDAYFHIEYVDEIPSKKSLHLFDLSGGGCGAETAANDDYLLAKGQVVKGYVKVGDAEHHLKGTVRHIRESGDKIKIKRFGIQFETLSEKETQSLSRTVLQIHREVFSRLKGE